MALVHTLEAKDESGVVLGWIDIEHADAPFATRLDGRSRQFGFLGAAIAFIEQPVVVDHASEERR